MKQVKYKHKNWRRNIRR